MSIGYKAASTKTPAAPPAMTPSAKHKTNPKILTFLLLIISYKQTFTKYVTEIEEIVSFSSTSL